MFWNYNKKSSQFFMAHKFKVFLFFGTTAPIGRSMFQTISFKTFCAIINVDRYYFRWTIVPYASITFFIADSSTFYAFSVSKTSAIASLARFLIFGLSLPHIAHHWQNKSSLHELSHSYHFVLRAHGLLSLIKLNIVVYISRLWVNVRKSISSNMIDIKTFWKRSKGFITSLPSCLCPRVIWTSFLR